MTTIRDVAKRAGVSTSTVSHVINQTRFVSENTRGRVLDAMRELEYKPNQLARSLRSRRTNTFGVLLPDSANPYFAAILAGIEAASFERGYNIIIGNANNDPQREYTYLDVLTSKQIDGMLLISTGSFSESIRILQEQKVPVVLVDRPDQQGTLDVVMANNRQGGVLATHHLIERGHQRIACIAGPDHLMNSVERREGYFEALQAAGIDHSPAMLVNGNFDTENGYTACQQLLDLPHRPTAIFACNDLMAIGALRAISERGLRVPDDISLVGFDNIQLASYTVPRLTTIKQPTAALGRRAVERLIERVSSPYPSGERDVLDVILIERDSTRSL